jgi:hypothetical protein
MRANLTIVMRDVLLAVIAADLTWALIHGWG